MDPNVEAVKRKLGTRSAKGVAEYGVTTAEQEARPTEAALQAAEEFSVTEFRHAMLGQHEDGTLTEHIALAFDAFAAQRAAAVEPWAAVVRELVSALEAIREYWNRDGSPEAMFDACNEVIHIADNALADTSAALLGTPAAPLNVGREDCPYRNECDKEDEHVAPGCPVAAPDVAGAVRALVKKWRAVADGWPNGRPIPQAVIEHLAHVEHDVAAALLGAADELEATLGGEGE